MGKKKIMKIKNNIILAMDLMDYDSIIKTTESVLEELNTIKIGYPLTLSQGPQIITEFKENYNINIICDYKVADIPATNEKICKSTFEYGADAIIAHGFTGEDSIQACHETAKDYKKELFLLTEMSHPGAKTFIQPIANQIAELGVKLGINNYVAPSTRINRLKEIREIVGKNAFIISPGVGTQGGNPKETLQYANALIIGRSIYNAPNPNQALKDIIKTL